MHLRKPAEAAGSVDLILRQALRDALLLATVGASPPILRLKQVSGAVRQRGEKGLP